MADRAHHRHPVVEMRRLKSSVLWPAAVFAGLIALLATIDPLLRYERVVGAPDPLSEWPLTPGITLGVLVAAWLYIRGERDAPPGRADRHPTARRFAFFGGLAVLFLMLQSPLDTLSDHLFFVHQIEHMVLRTIAPILLVLSAPQAALLRGLPDWLRRHVASPFFGSGVFRGLRVFGHPVVATALFIATTYFWMIPRFYDIALLDEPVHIYLWHTSLFLSGLIFFWRILDPRPYPLGASLGTRLWMFCVASIGNILLGSYLSLKSTVIYTAYDRVGRLWGVGGLTDETFGGLTMWIMGCMMFAMAALLMIYRWAQWEERRQQHPRGQPAIGTATTAAALIAQRRAANRKVALGLACFAALVLLGTFSVVIVYHFSDLFQRPLVSL